MVALLALLYRPLFLNETFVDRDLRAYYRPAKSLIAPLTRASDTLPLWNPLFAQGQPFAANPEHEIFHPFTTLFFFVPFEWAFRLQVILPLVLAPFGMGWLLRTLGRTRAAAVFGALVWGLGGYVLSVTNLLPILFAIVPLPWALGCFLRLVRTPSAAWTGRLALAFGLVALAGEPSTILITAGLICVVAVAWWAERAPREPAPAGLHVARALGMAAGGLALGVALAACVLVSGVSHARKTVRAEGLGLAQATQWSMPPVRIVELVAPHALGHIERADERWYWGGPLYGPARAPFIFSIYPGLLASLLAGFAACRRGWNADGVWLLAALAGVALAVGLHLPFFGLARVVIPLVSGLRYPEKFVLVTVLSLVVLASSGFDRVLLGRRGFRAIQRAAFVLGGAGALAAAAAALSGSPELWRRLGADAAVAPGMTRTVIGDAALVGTWGILFGVVAGAFPRLGRRRAAAALLVASSVDLVVANRVIMRTLPIPQVAAPPTYLRRALTEPLDGTLAFASARDARRALPAYMGVPPVVSQWGIATALEDDIDLTELRWSRRATQLLWEVVADDASMLAPLLRRRGVAAVVWFKPAGRRAPGSEPLELVYTKSPQPLAFFVDRIERIPGDGDWKAAVRRLGPAAASAACVEERDAAGLPAAPAPGAVRVAHRQADRMTLDVAGAGPESSLLAVNQTWDEGWSATVDGRPSPVLRTDVSLMGLAIPPGPHRVELVYRDAWVTRGIALSLLSALLCGALALRRPV